MHVLLMGCYLSVNALLSGCKGFTNKKNTLNFMLLRHG